MTICDVSTDTAVLADELPQGLDRPLVCRWPTGKIPAGIVIFCHGLGANGREYATLSHDWAAHGYFVVHPTFDDAIEVVAAQSPELGLNPADDLRRWVTLPAVRAHMHHVLHAPDSWVRRVKTVGVILESLRDILAATCGCPDVPLPIAIAGHSFGAYTSQLLAGVTADLPDHSPRSFADDRFAAAIIISGQGRDQQGLRDGSWDSFTLPALTLTGTLDRGANGGGWEWKSEPFSQASATDQYLAVIDGGDHFLGGFDEDDWRPANPAQAAAVRQITLGFLDAILKRDNKARAALRATSDHIGDCHLSFQYR